MVDFTISMLKWLKSKWGKHFSYYKTGKESNQSIDWKSYFIMSTWNVLTMCLQETCHHGNEILENGYYRLITSGLSQNVLNSNHGSWGVANTLSQEGVTAWKAAVPKLHNGFGAQIIAIQLLFKDIHNKDVSVFLVSAYASVGNAPDDIWNEYLGKTNNIYWRKHWSYILIIGTDANCSTGTASARSDGPLGYFGLNHVNEAGKRFLSYLCINNLAVVTRFFKKNQYSTWIHPRGKKMHQIYHFVIKKEMLHCCIDAGITS